MIVGTAREGLVFSVRGGGGADPCHPTVEVATCLFLELREENMLLRSSYSVPMKI